MLVLGGFGSSDSVLDYGTGGCLLEFVSIVPVALLHCDSILLPSHLRSFRINGILISAVARAAGVRLRVSRISLLSLRGIQYEHGSASLVATRFPLSFRRP